MIFSLLTGGACTVCSASSLPSPVAATLRLVLIYVGAKLRDEAPFPQLEQELEVRIQYPGGPRTQPARAFLRDEQNEGMSTSVWSRKGFDALPAGVLIQLVAALLQGTVAPLIAVGEARPSLPILVAASWSRRGRP